MFTATVIALAVSTTTGAEPPTPTAPGDVVTSFEGPCRYPAGLTTDGEHLYAADWRHAAIYQVTPDGQVVRSWDAPTLMPHGLTWNDGLLYVCDDHTGGVYALDLETGVVENTFQAPNSKATGLAFAEETLFILAGGKIYEVIPEDGTILGYFSAPTSGCRCLAYDGKYLWVADREADEIYMLDAEREKVVGILDAPGPYAAGITWFGGNLWNIDFQTRKVYQLVITGERRYSLKDTRRARVEYLWSLANYGPGTITDLKLNIALPMELPNQKLLTEPEFLTSPAQVAADKWDQQCALFELGEVAAGDTAVLTYSVNAEISHIRYLIIPEKVGSIQEIPAEIREKYTADSTRYRISTPYMQETVKKIIGDEENPYWIARKIYDFIISSLHYEMIGGWDVPEVVLKRGSGSCSEYTYSFVALCRAAGVPARYQGSIVVRGDDASIDEAFHRWAQVYLPGYGWVPVDANRGDKKSAADQGRAFGELANRFLITTQGGGGSEYLSWGYNSFAEYKAVGYCNVREDNFGFFEPLDTEEIAQKVLPEDGGAGGAGQCP